MGHFVYLRRDLEESAENVILNPLWHGADKTISTYKTPTYMLLNEKREFEAFGYEAEKKYFELYQQGRHERCFFFRRFKTKLHGIQVLTIFELLDEQITFSSKHLRTRGQSSIDTGEIAHCLKLPLKPTR